MVVVVDLHCAQWMLLLVVDVEDPALVDKDLSLPSQEQADLTLAVLWGPKWVPLVAVVKLPMVALCVGETVGFPVYGICVFQPEYLVGVHTGGTVAVELVDS